jgi:hypothetical protein
MTSSILFSFMNPDRTPAKAETLRAIVRDLREAAQAAGRDAQFIYFDDYVTDPRTAQVLDCWHRAGHSGLTRLYDEVRSRLAGGTIFIVVDINVYHPDFLESLNAYKVFFSPDDPDGSFQKSMPYAYAFDHVATVTPYYQGSTVTMPSQFLKWGAKRASFIPFGTLSSEYGSLDENEVFSQPRGKDVVFVGTMSPWRIALLRELHRAIGNRLKIYSRRSFVQKLRLKQRYPDLPWASNLVHTRTVYRNCAVGINIHDSGVMGFGNRRVYELPINGICQVCDFKNRGLELIYDQGQEVLGYDNAEELCKAVDFALTNPGRAQEIARAGFRKVKGNYLFKGIWTKFLRDI